MRFAGIDIASETHVVAVVGEDERDRSSPRPSPRMPRATRGCSRYSVRPAMCWSPWRPPATTGRTSSPCWPRPDYRRGVAQSLAHPSLRWRGSRTHQDRRHRRAWASPALPRKSVPPPTQLPDAVTEELRELVRLRERLLQDFGDRLRQLHRLVDLGFPEFTRYVHSLDSELASTILHDYPTAAAFHRVSVNRLAGLRYDGRHHVGPRTGAGPDRGRPTLRRPPSRPRLSRPGPVPLRGPGPPAPPPARTRWRH